jgi:hypothetical protein
VAVVVAAGVVELAALADGAASLAADLPSMLHPTAPNGTHVIAAIATPANRFRLSMFSP